jgi:hypothetical protein
MKTILLLLALSILPVHAQRKLWTVPAPADADQLFGRCFQASAVDAVGNAAVIIGEAGRYEPSEHFFAEPTLKRIRLMWISSRGVVLHDETVDASSEQAASLLGAEKLTVPWSILAITANKWAVTNGWTLWTGTLKGKTPTVIRKDLPYGTDIAPAGALPPFAGWFEREAASAEFIYPWSLGGIQPETRTGSFTRIAGFALWSAK